MKRFLLFSLILLAADVVKAGAQVAPSAYDHGMSITVGGMGSLFQPDYGPNRLLGAGVFVDFKFTRWVQFEGESRWLRWNQYANVYQDNYLIGPRVPIHRFGRATPYGKVLVGLGEMNFPYNYAYGRFTALAYGGGVDIQLNRHWAIRPIDFEYQEWPKWLAGQGQLFPYGGSAGISYRVLGGR